MKQLNPKAIEILKTGTLEQRRYICEKEPVYFFVYYFPQFFTYPIAPFHWDMYDDLKDLRDGNITQLAWIAFRESAKTSLAKMYIMYCIAYKKKHYINYDSFTKKNAEKALFDITVQLQTNQKLIADFGQLYNEPSTREKKTKKTISDFLTSNGIKVEAFSTNEPTRGRIHGEHRPDLFILDDFENNKTKDSLAYTEAVISHIDEMQGGLAPTASVIYLGNYITETGSVDWIISQAENNDRMRVRKVAIIENGKPTWPGKYTLTNQEASLNNKVSIEQKRKEIEHFEAEMMNNPYSPEDLFFDRDKVEKAIENAKEPDNIVAGVHIWGSYKPHHRYAIGADTSEGIGKDSNTLVTIDFTTGEAIATYADANISPDQFAYVLKDTGNRYGECLVAPERNNTGFATITELKNIYDNIYQEIRRGTVIDQTTKRLGFNTTSSTKPEILYQFKTAFEDGDITIYDRRLLEEMKIFTRNRMTDRTTALTTRHFDLLMAACIAWAMREYAESGGHPYSRAEDEALAEERMRANEPI